MVQITEEEFFEFAALMAIRDEQYALSNRSAQDFIDSSFICPYCNNRISEGIYEQVKDKGMFCPCGKMDVWQYRRASEDKGKTPIVHPYEKPSHQELEAALERSLSIPPRGRNAGCPVAEDYCAEVCGTEKCADKIREWALNQKENT